LPDHFDYDFAIGDDPDRNSSGRALFNNNEATAMQVARRLRCVRHRGLLVHGDDFMP